MLSPFPSIANHNAPRWQHTRLRRRLLEGTWADDLRARLQAQISAERRLAWGEGDTSKNLFRNIVVQLASLYDKPGTIAHTDNDGTSAREMDALLRGAGWWQLAIRHQRYVVGLRESLVRVAVLGEGEDVGLQLRLVTPDLVECMSAMDSPDEPHTVIEYRVREVSRGAGTEPEWTRDVVSIADPSNPVLRVEDERGKDISAQYGVAGWPDRWRDASGAPVLPYVLYHAERTGHLWDPYEGKELVDGALSLAVLWTYWHHIVRSASHPQRALFNARPMGGVKLEDHAGVRIGRIEEDPSSILLLEAVDATKPATAHQWQPGGDAEAIGRAVRDHASDLSLDLGISASDIDRTHGNAQSGYAVQLSRDGVRRAQQRYQPEAERGDRQLCRVVACQHNRATGGRLAEDGYLPHYTGLDTSLEERRLELDRLLLEMDRGLTSPVDAYMRLHGVTREQATDDLTRIQAERLRFNATK